MTDDHGITAAHNEWFFPRGGLGRDGWESVVDERIPGWRHAGLRVADLDTGDLTLPADPAERLIVPLSGSFRVCHEGTVTVLDGRASVFDGPADVLYLGTGTAASIGGRGRVAVAEAPTAARFPSRRIRRGEVPVEIRGAGRDTRQVHNFGTPETLDAGSFIVCEVITPAGNWSSHPAHKHDEHVPGRESRLAEIYYFEAALAQGLDGDPDGGPTDAFGLFASYSSPAGRIDTNAIVRTGDIALVPYGYHGPAVAAPEYDLYYLNVMAGPGPQRAWQVTDDPAQAWIRARWDGEPTDPRLPYRRDERYRHEGEEASG
jgi:5-deoxy-glucuronate isomerase